MTRIAVVLFEDAEELDWAGPWEVLATWANGWCRTTTTLSFLGAVEAFRARSSS